MKPLRRSGLKKKKIRTVEDECRGVATCRHARHVRTLKIVG